MIHRNVLRVNSEVIAAKLGHAGGCSHDIDLSEVNVKNGKAMVDFMYTQKAPDVAFGDADEFMDLLRTADKYGIMELKSACVEPLLGLLSPSNAMKIFQFGTQLKLKPLVVKAAEFISKSADAFLEEEGQALPGPQNGMIKREEPQDNNGSEVSNGSSFEVL